MGELIKYNVPVEGMTCASCVARVEKAIGKLDGVTNVNVNFATEKASFEIDPKKIDFSKIAGIVEDAGYKLSNVEKFQKEDSQNEIDFSLNNDFFHAIKKDFRFALLFTIPIFSISMLMEFNWFHQLFPVSMDYINKILLILTTPVVFVSGKRFYVAFWNNLKHFAADMNSLVAIGTGTAYGYSLLATLFPVLITSSFKLPHVYYDSTAVIITLILLGRFLENRAKQKTNSAIRELLELKPKETLVRRNGNEIKVKVDELVLKDIVIIKPGEKIPSDGKIISGSTTIDESMVTGESFPLEKGIGAKVIGGTINKNGTFDFEITALGKNSVLGQIITLVEEAQGSKAPIQKLADKVAAVFVPVVVGIAILTFISWLVFGDENSFNFALINFVAVLIIACPCALGLATPTAIIVGTGLGAKHGILIKNGESLELAHKISTIIVDKTGTLTEGKPLVTDLITNNFSEEELLCLAASVENKSEHPIGQAIVEYAQIKKIDLKNLDTFQNITGNGITALIGNTTILVGNENLLKEYSIKNEKFNKEFSDLSSEGKSTVFVAIDGEVKGIIAVEDPIKANSKEAIAELKKMNINVVMVTGDNQKTAAAIAKRVGIENFSAQVLPEDKLKIVEKFQNQNHVVAVAGDGINDSPALAKSDVGIAMGSGTDVAIESSDITLLKGDLMSIVKMIKLSRRTIRIIKQNLFWAFIFNAIGIPLAALGLLNPMFAALAMSFSSVSVVSNSLRLRKSKF
ncbi:MAG: heavy metal translocating P-type ATPase [Ignavibacteriales bacterium]|nr:heavy metal translocating P-type ATPase [Ignavibacteriales bacterium]